MSKSEKPDGQKKSGSVSSSAASAQMKHLPEAATGELHREERLAHAAEEVLQTEMALSEAGAGALRAEERLAQAEAAALQTEVRLSEAAAGERRAEEHLAKASGEALYADQRLTEAAAKEHRAEVRFAEAAGGAPGYPEGYNPDERYRLNFAGSIFRGMVGDLIPVTIRIINDQGGDAQFYNQTTVELTSKPDASFYRDPDGKHHISETTIRNGETASTFYFAAPAAGKYTLHAEAEQSENRARVEGASASVKCEKVQAVFSNLKSAAIVYGTSQIAVSGVLKAGKSVPAGSVTATIAGAGVSGTSSISSGGNFSVNLNPQGIDASAIPYPIALVYAEDGKIKGATDNSTTLTVEKASPVFTKVNASSVIYGPGSITVTGSLADGLVIPAGPKAVTIKVPNTTIADCQCEVDKSGGFSATLQTDGVPASAYSVICTYAGNSNFNPAPDGSSGFRVDKAAVVLTPDPASIIYGRAPVELSGKVQSSNGREIPSGSASISFNGKTIPAAIDKSAGTFRASFDTSNLPLSGGPPLVTYSYPGDSNFMSSPDIPIPATYTVVPISGKLALSGNGIHGVPVTAIDASGNVVDQQNTRPDGRYTLTVPAGLTVHVDFPPNFVYPPPDGRKVYLRGAPSNWVQPFAPAAVDAAYELRDPLISGTTVKQIAGTNSTEPFPGVRVYLLDAATLAEVERQTTDAQGRFAFSRCGQYILRSDAQMRQGDSVLSPTTAATGILAGPDRPAPALAPIVYQALGAQVVGQVTDGVNGLEGITVELFSAATKEKSFRDTDPLGFYSFPNIAAGGAALSFQTLAKDKSGNKWELKAGEATSQTLALASGDMKTAAATVYESEKHTIRWTVTSQGRPAHDKLVEVRTKDGKSVVGAKRTDDKGVAFFELEQANEYSVWVYPDDRTPGGVLTHPVRVNSNYSGTSDVPAVSGAFGPPGGGGGGGGGEVRESVIDLQSYPILTEEVPAGMGPMQRGSGGSAGSDMAPLGQTAQNAINEVLSWRSKPTDPKAFVSALNQAFSLKDFEGHTEWAWTPRSYTVQTDMGAVTGAQASIYNRATVALNQSLPLLDGLYPLLPTIPQEDLNSIREVARSEYTSLVNEFGVVGGPRAPRVDQLFLLLLGDLGVTDPESLTKGTLYTLRNRFGLRRQYVTTIEDEQNLTNFLILADYIIGLNQSWKNEKRYFVRNGGGGVEPYFGTQLVLLSRALDVVSQSVRDAYFAMDSVFLGASERQTAQLNFSGVHLPRALVRETEPHVFPVGTSSLFVSELLDWVDRAASEELPQVLQTSGKDGLPALKSVLDDLRHFVRAAILPTQKAPNLPPGYRTPRVQRTMQELADALDETYQQSFDIREPRLPIFGLKSHQDQIE